MSFNFVDLIILFLLFLCGYIGFRRGFLRSVIDLAGFVIAFIIAIRFYPQLSSFILSHWKIFQFFANIVSFFTIFVVTRIVFGVIAWLLEKIIPFRSVRLANRIGGAILWILAGLFIMGLALFLIALFPQGKNLEDQIKHSLIGSRVLSAAKIASPFIEKNVGQKVKETLVFLTVKERESKLGLNIPGLTDLKPDYNGEQKMLELVNEERSASGLDALVMDSKLQEVARKHSEEMFKLKYFAHDSPISGTPFERMNKARIFYFVAGENIALSPDVETAHRGLMNSPEHRDNILNPKFKKIGIGIIKDGIYGEMFTQDFTG